MVFLVIPPLRERKDDISLLTKHFVGEYNSILGTKIKGVDAQVEDAFLSYSWPGNVRELKHVIESAFNFTEGDRIGLSDLPQYFFNESPLPIVGDFDLNAALESFEKKYLSDAISGSTSLQEAADKLKISRQNLRHKLKRFGLDGDEI